MPLGEVLREPGVHERQRSDGVNETLHVGTTALEPGHNNPLDHLPARPDSTTANHDSNYKPCSLLGLPREF
jgi:hypothetical protein